ncbi:MAG TPA: multifunctional oxoglutarate decarboxylase/oxoglutarate dehydrogenase thiamine pyrophosphate-binding subunit/dihydrolipoyllysine-residue succinyltransferase subunit, partial [Pyrinomonadaceae bacterium]|nr:multifunctional oxoglutarate decarboxylase/oxoglutarate dehydrogenase thiamine pyrophosphate-binding subunit/dihydrolipoyllysine-residue succinyltransferase subunit [Pyrinomonadaceae bacterium]
ENFGANATYVEGLLSRYRSNPSLVDEAWRAYFAELLGEQQAAAGDGASATQGGNGAATAFGQGEETRNASVWPTDEQSQAATQETEAAQTTRQAAQPSAGATETAGAAEATAATVATEAVAATGAGMGAGAPASTDARQTGGQATGHLRGEAQPIRGGALKVVENMETSLGVPTATSNRQVPVKVLEENRRLVNQFLTEQKRGKASFTHFIAFAVLRALERFPQMNDGFAVVEGRPVRVRRTEVNLGVAVDLEKKDGTRTLLVPNIKNAGTLQFADFLAAYSDVIKRAREGKLGLPDFQDTTISLTNPGTIGTVSSNPRLMAGQSVIVATGAIEYPAEYHAMTPEALSLLGISKIINVSSTYDHRIIQGAESGAFLAHVHELLLGEHEFYIKIFRDLGIPYQPMRWSKDYNPALLGRYDAREEVEKEARVLELINAYRVRGHLIADIDPLNAMPVQYHPELDIETYGLTIWDLDREFITGGLGGKHNATLREILDILRRAYCGKVGSEYRHIQSKEQKVWLRERVRQEFVNPEPLPAETKKTLLLKLVRAEQFERFLHTKYLGQKRFSLEGCETIIPLLDQLVERAAEKGIEDITLGMAHRGRLNVLANVVGNFSERIFTAFEGSVHPDFPADEGDVKYHQGAKGERETASGKRVRITISPNPSHLEFVDPVVEGMVRAKQDALELGGSQREEVIDRALPVLLHGDAAFAGQGIVMETLQLADLHGYRTGGTIHIIINNQIGFTTSPEASRSSIYSTDVAKMTQLPIFHINGDDPEAAFRTLRIALDFRQEFNKDVVLDVIGFRRLGHNEGDEPSYTQPLMYARVKAHPGVRALYARRLVSESVVTEEEVGQMLKEATERYEQIHARAKEIVAQKEPLKELPPAVAEEDGSEVFETPVSAQVIRDIAHRIAVIPEGFHINPKMVSQLARRAKMGEGQAALDWAFAELLAFGSLGLEGVRVRLSGQDSGRGTFSQRHAILYDTQTGQPWSPLSEMTARDGRALVEVFDSSLSEQGVLGFEYGYSVVARDALVCWEAQFGDFSNGAQVITDAFVAVGVDKWQQPSRLVLLLPHGFEGQGPEHSSARLERYLQLCAENNMQVCYPTTPAQYFHLLRRQVKQGAARPLVVMTPKSLLRLPAATSSIEELTQGGFRPVIDDAEVEDRSAVLRIVLSSGKVFYDLAAARKKSGDARVAIVRLEQFYPFPERALREVFASYPNSTQLVWCQEEPKNMGGWVFVEPRLMGLLGGCERPYYAGRAASASPATGSYTIHELEQRKLVNDALTAEAPYVSGASTKAYAGQADS